MWTEGCYNTPCHCERNKKGKEKGKKTHEKSQRPKYFSEKTNMEDIKKNTKWVEDKPRQM
jgi:hypothetical protein